MLMSEVAQDEVSSHVWHDSFRCVTWLIQMCDMTHLYVWRDSSIAQVEVSSHTCEWVMSHIWMSHVTHMNESCHTSEWVMSHIWMSHVTHLNESCHTYEWVMSHIWMSRVIHLNESCHRCEWVMSHLRMITFHVWTHHVTRVNESWHKYEWVMAQIWMSHGTCEGVTSRTCMSHVTHMNESCNTH